MAAQVPVGVDVNQNVVSNSPPTAFWNPNDRKYNALLCTCHVTQCIKLIGIFDILMVVVGSLINIVFYGIMGSSYKGLFWTQVCFGVAVIVIIALLFRAEKTENHWYFLPHVVYQGIFLALFLAAGAMSMAIIASKGSLFIGFCLKALLQIYPELKQISFLVKLVMKDPSVQSAVGPFLAKVVAVAAGALVVCLILLLLRIFMFWVILRCFSFYRDRQIHLKSLPQNVALTNVQPMLMNAPVMPNPATENGPTPSSMNIHTPPTGCQTVNC